MCSFLTWACELQVALQQARTQEVSLRGQVAHLEKVLKDEQATHRQTVLQHQQDMQQSRNQLLQAQTERAHSQQQLVDAQVGYTDCCVSGLPYVALKSTQSNVHHTLAAELVYAA